MIHIKMQILIPQACSQGEGQIQHFLQIPRCYDAAGVPVAHFEQHEARKHQDIIHCLILLLSHCCKLETLLNWTFSLP